MPTFTEAAKIGDVLKREYDRLFNRETVTILSGEDLVIGTVLGRVGSGAAGSSAAAAGNTGDGTMSAIVVGTKAINGDYIVTFVDEDTDAGDFIVEDPNGKNIGAGKVGVEFNKGGITFTISDGATDFATGDQFVVTVADAADKYKAYNAANTDGSEVAVGVLLVATDASAADASGVMLARGPAVVAEGALTGLDDEAKAALTALGIVVRQSVGQDAVSY